MLVELLMELQPDGTYEVKCLACGWKKRRLLYDGAINECEKHARFTHVQISKVE